ncbi:uncharacterized protein F4822DRAFT_87769 [Hypoxylon trugodes]|uniref:uncharacterized protein n=1 Tax=Hypoxylon trugodes TaxID=326681 RepID=UPI0021A17D14|nr:uncharacterized protein F4822DRAFT_87769 [Hypoxylon trugodes]KAI1382953.1 hypothetical protein F4822DRAFT_87769 [Hypoxylon trugodes]
MDGRENGPRKVVGRRGLKAGATFWVLSGSLSPVLGLVKVAMLVICWYGLLCYVGLNIEPVASKSGGGEMGPYAVNACFWAFGDKGQGENKGGKELKGEKRHGVLACSRGYWGLSTLRKSRESINSAFYSVHPVVIGILPYMSSAWHVNLVPNSVILWKSKKESTCQEL